MQCKGYETGTRLSWQEPEDQVAGTEQSRHGLEGRSGAAETGHPQGHGRQFGFCLQCPGSLLSWPVGSPYISLAPDRGRAAGARVKEADGSGGPEAHCLTWGPAARWLQQKLDQNPDHTLPFCWYSHESLTQILRESLGAWSCTVPPGEKRILSLEAQRGLNVTCTTPGCQWLRGRQC